MFLLPCHLLQIGGGGACGEKELRNASQSLVSCLSHLDPLPFLHRYALNFRSYMDNILCPSENLLGDKEHMQSEERSCYDYPQATRFRLEDDACR